MARGLEKHLERQRQLSLFGKDLTRRSGACCELCSASGVKLEVYEVPPTAAEPVFEECLFICEECKEALARPKSASPDRWRNLIETVWSEVPAVQVMAVRILDSLSKEHPWAAEILDQVYLDEEIEEWVKKQALL
ncbi:MAG: phnA protein [Verrucomicrobiota bacterium]